MTDSTDTPKNESTPTSAETTETSASTTKKTAKKTSKRTTKKAASKAATKKVAKKPVAKKTTKKTVKKTTRKKTASKSKAAAEQSESIIDDQVIEDSGVDSDIDTDTDTDFNDDGPMNKRDDRDDHDDMDEIDELDDFDDSEDADDDSEDDSDTDSDEDSDADSKPARRSSKKPSRKKSASRSGSSRSSKSSSSSAPAQAEMIINYVPGEECRVAMLENGKLEEFAVEPTDRVSRVGNIYVGRIANIEPAIQAVFVDFGTEENGFLHVSDLHPQYFAKGEDKTERVGKKTPRKSRPPIQDCLKRGQEIIVQILKEGVGTKGPTLTSYLSIPGRFLVMMPGMDKVGVSRKEEDDDKRRAAKQILSQLELPDGFGFILRTAGFDRNKAELKRDLSYLARLWKDMEARRKGGNKPRLLYTESDLLVRSIRDLLTSEVTRVVIDSEPALRRVARFIKIAAPRSGAKLTHYNGTKPIFHAFGIETQINEIHAREVMLPSGGRLVIDQTEALVAIDVNSGKSRGARDAESNAFQTNMEAVDAICRQLRLRDLGGLVVNDMIDMRFHSHRKEVETRFAERLKRDRAKTSTAPISPFGLLEMTRQRMRGSMESQHFADCPMCHGRGLVKRPDSVASTALRDLAALLDHPMVFRAELVVNPRVASALLSTRRASLTRIELISGKTLDVRVSESLPIDRVSFYAYDERSNDIAIEKLKPAQRAEPSVVEWRDESSPDGSWAMDPLDEVDEATVQKLAEEIARKADQAEHAQLPIEGELETDEDDDSDQPKKKRRRRRRRGGKGRSGEESNGDDSNGDDSNHEDRNDDSRRVEASDDEESNNDNDSETSDSHDDEHAPKKKRRRRRRRGGKGRSDAEGQGEGSHSEESDSSRQHAEESESSNDRDESNDRTPRAESTRDDNGRNNERNNDHDDSEPRPRRRPRRRPARNSGADTSKQQSESSNQSSSDRVREPKPRSESRSDARPNNASNDRPSPSKPAPAKETPAPVVSAPKRGLYSKSRRVLSPSELARLGLE